MNIKKSLKKKSLIKGLFRELAVMRVPLFGRDKSGVDFLCTIGEIREVNYLGDDGDLIILDSDSIFEEGDKITLFFSNGPDFYSCQTICIDRDGSAFSIPEEMELLPDKRSPRAKVGDFSQYPVIVEIRSPGIRTYGRLVDYSSSSLRIRLASKLDPTSIGISLEIVGYYKSKEVLRSEGRIIRSEEGRGVENFVILEVNRKSESKTFKERSHKRFNTAQAALRIRWLTDQNTCSYKVRNYGLAGVALERTEHGDPVPLGAKCEIYDLGIRAKVVWSSPTSIGLDLSEPNEKEKNVWIKHIEALENFGEIGADHESRRLLLKLLLRSGYLRGIKAQTFKEELLEQLIPDISTSSTWLRRYIGNSSQHGERHISFLRLSDQSWMIQELAQYNSTVSAHMTLDDAISRFAYENSAESRKNEVLIALYDRSSAFNMNYWECDTLKEVGSTYDAFVGKVTAHSGPVVHSFSAITDQIKDSTSLAHISKRLLRTIGIDNDVTNSPWLAEQLQVSGYCLNRKLAILHHGSAPSAIAVSFGLPTFSNLSTTANHLWILFDPNKTQPTEVIQALGENSNFSNLLNGVSEYVAISTANINFAYNSKSSERLFGLRIIPLDELRRFGGRF